MLASTTRSARLRTRPVERSDPSVEQKQKKGWALMLKGLRTAIKYFTIGLLAGLLLAPRKGDETRKLLMERGKEYAQEAMNMNLSGERTNA